MFKVGIRRIKKTKNKEYLYYMYYDKDGYRNNKYCGCVGDVQTELNALQHEYDIRLEAGIQNDKRLKAIEASMNQLSKKLK